MTDTGKAGPRGFAMLVLELKSVGKKKTLAQLTTSRKDAVKHTLVVRSLREIMFFSFGCAENLVQLVFRAPRQNHHHC